ncbi:uncharacterized protein LOC144919502 [Branchiostoma floridae x Branchiostoma belcheri]
MERRYGVDVRPRVSPELVGPTKSAWPTYCDHLYTRGRPKGKRTKRKVRPSEAPTQTKCSTGEPRTAALSSSYSSLRGVSPFENSSSSVSGVEFDLESERSFYLPFEDDADGESGFGSLPGTPEVPESERTSCCDDDQISFTTQDTSISDYCASETSEGKESEDTSFFKTQQEKPAADVFPPCVETRDHRSEEKLEKPHREKPATDVFTATAEITADNRDKRGYKGPWRHYGPPGIPEILRRKEKKRKDEDDLRRLKKLLIIFSSLSVLALAVVVAIVMGHFLQPEELPDWLALFSFPGKEDPLIRDDLRAIVSARTPPDIPPVISDCFNVSLPLADHGSYTCSDVTYGPRFGQLYIVTFCVLRCDVGYHGEDAGLLFCDNSGDNSTWSPVAPEVVSSLVGLGQAASVVTRSESLTANLTQLGVNGTIYTRETAGVMSRLDLADEISLGSLEENLALFEFHTAGIIGDPYVLRQALSHTSPDLIAEVSRLNFTAALAELDAFGASKNPECKKLDCGEPQEPGNGSLHGGNTQFGDEFTVHCDPGYERRHARIRCLGNGNWSLEAMCDPVDCGQPQNISAGMHVCQGTAFTQTCHVTCDVGYVPVTSDDLICTSSRKWARMPEGTNITELKYNEQNASEVLACERVACGNITVPAEGAVTCSGTRYNDTCDFSCAEGYIPTAGTQFACDAAGNWTGLPECTPVECGDPPSFPNTEFECSAGTSFPGSCTASCGTGYRNTNYTHVTCGSHGNWTLGNHTEILLERLADDYFCERKDCGVLQEPTSGSLACTGTRFEDTCKLTCDTGYEVTEDDGISLFDEEGYTCTESGTWSSQPTCGESDFCLHGHDDCDPQYGVCEHTGHRNYSCRCAQGTLGDGRSCALPVCGVLNATEPDHGKLFCESQSSLGMGSADCRDPSPSGVDNQEYASVCRLICNPGYKQTLDVSYMCLKNGTWHAPLDLENENIQPCVDIDECLSTPCKNNATCSNLENAYSCACVPGFTGTDCDEEVNECDSDPCRNGGSCSDGVDDYTCSCLPGWTGEICETDIDECSSNPCQHGGTCEDHVNGYTCHCAEGWEGEDCEINIDDCAGVTCQHGGRCVDHVSAYSCNCTGGWIGEHCDTRASSCAVLKDAGYIYSGSYVIDPDGPEVGEEPFPVLCDLDNGTTLVGHDSEDRTGVSPGCEAAGCYSREVKYLATPEQLSALVAVSNSCRQFVKYECHNSILNIAWWSSPGGQRQVHWAGAGSGRHTCSCGESGTCEDDNPACNCDNNDNVWREDSGWLTDKNTLPVMQLNFGDTGDPGESAFHTLGRFACEGMKQ